MSNKFTNLLLLELTAFFTLAFVGYSKEIAIITIGLIILKTNAVDFAEYRKGRESVNFIKYILEARPSVILTITIICIFMALTSSEKVLLDIIIALMALIIVLPVVDAIAQQLESWKSHISKKRAKESTSLKKAAYSSPTNSEASKIVATEAKAKQGEVSARQCTSKSLPPDESPHNEPLNKKENKTMKAYYSSQIANAIDVYIKENGRIGKFDRELGYARIEWTAMLQDQKPFSLALFLGVENNYYVLRAQPLTNKPYTIGLSLSQVIINLRIINAELSSGRFEFMQDDSICYRYITDCSICPLTPEMIDRSIHTALVVWRRYWECLNNGATENMTAERTQKAAEPKAAHNITPVKIPTPQNAEESPQCSLKNESPVDNPQSFSISSDSASDRKASFTGDGIPIDAKHFPDANFRKYVSNHFDRNRDNKLDESEISTVKEIYVRYCGIASLKGIEYFVNLEKLNCSDNVLTFLDISHNPALVKLSCSSRWEGKLTKLDVSRNPALKELDCHNNRLASLDVSHNLALEKLYCNNNRLTDLDVSHNSALKELYCRDNKLIVLSVFRKPKLKRLDCVNNRLTSLTVLGNSALGYLDCRNNHLSDLDVSWNPALKYLNCSANNLTSLDISQNPELKRLYCRNNNLTNIDISRNHVLEYLYCQKNSLIALAISENPELEVLRCHSNKLTSLDVSKNLQLKYLDCRGNRLTSLNISENLKLKKLKCNFSVALTGTHFVTKIIHIN